MKTKRLLHGIRQEVKKAPPKLRLFGGLGLLLLLLVTLTIIVIKKVSYHNEQARLESEAKAGPKVRVSRVERSSGDRTVQIIGEAVPFNTATLYAKVSGYLNDIYVDKGDRVKKGDQLATISSPETDQNYLGARSDSINRSDIARRMRTLIKRDLISPQEYEQAQSDAELARSRYLAAATLKGYEDIQAPFTGTITARYVDPGSLIQNAQAGQSGAAAIVTISQLDVLRTYVYLDQRDASFVKEGDPVMITLAERPDFVLSAKVDRIAGQLDTKTRMMLIEIDIDNQKNEIVAGSLVTVSVPIKIPIRLQAPIDALVNLETKTLVPVVKKDNTITYREVKISDNDGKKVSFLSGVEEGELLALSLGVNVPEGAKVRPILPKEQSAVNRSMGGAPPAVPKESLRGGAVTREDREKLKQEIP